MYHECKGKYLILRPRRQSLSHALGNTHTGKKFFNQCFKAEGFISFGNQLIQYIMNGPLHSKAKQCSRSSSLLLFLIRFCTTATSSSCLFSSLFELCRKCCAFLIGIRGGVRPCYPGFDKTTVAFVLTTESCDVYDQVTPRNVYECVLWLGNAMGMLSRASSVYVNQQREGGREEEREEESKQKLSALTDV